MTNKNKILDDVIENLKNSAWNFQLILPIYLSTLHKSEFVANWTRLPVFYKSMLHFKKITHVQPPRTPKGKIYNPLTLHDSASQDYIKQVFGINCVCNSIGRKELEDINKATKMLEEKDHETYKNFYSFADGLSVITGSTFRSGTHPHIWGLIFLNNDYIKSESRKVALSIVHEMGHLELYLINSLDRMIAPGEEKNNKFSPFQQRARPPLGRLHSAHALYRMILSNLSTEEEKNEFRRILCDTCKTFDEEELTPFAKEILNVFKREAEKHK